MSETMNYTKTNPFRLILSGSTDDDDFLRKYLPELIKERQETMKSGVPAESRHCKKCGEDIHIGLEDYYHRESINHNSTRADLHKHCFRTGGTLTDQSGNANKMWKRRN